MFHIVVYQKRKEKAITKLIYTVFPKDEEEMPQDFDTYSEAFDFAEEEYGAGNYIIEAA